MANEDTNTQRGESLVKMDTKIGVMMLQAKECERVSPGSEMWKCLGKILC